MLPENRRVSAMKSYMIFFMCPDSTVRIGKKEFRLEKGIYSYLGSCGSSCSKRIGRHMNRNFSKKRWHVDYLPCKPLLSLTMITDERTMSLRLIDVPHIPGFGNSDDRPHPRLFLISDLEAFLESILLIDSCNTKS